MTKLTTIGLDMPDDFPSDAYEGVHKLVCALDKQRQICRHTDTPTREWKEYAGAWNAVAHRFLSLARQAERFAASIESFGASPESSQRHVQEDSLFFFFAAGLSCIESFGYGLYAIASMINPNEFRMATEDELRAINLKSATSRFEKSFSVDLITVNLKSVIKSQEYKDWKLIRNVLSHRTHPSRAFAAGGGNPAITWQLKDIPIDKNITGSRRDWMADALRSLVEATLDFCSTYLQTSEPDKNGST